jgi:hypothetical protein
MRILTPVVKVATLAMFDPRQNLALRGAVALQLSLSRLNHRLPGCEAYPEVVQGTAEFHHQIAYTLLPQADPVLDDATALDTAIDMVDPQPTLVQRLVRHGLLPRMLLAQIEINSNEAFV